MKKKLFILLLSVVSVICIAVGFSACGGLNDSFTNSDSTNTSDSSTDNDKTETVTASEGLEYALSNDESYYTVSGIGSCTDIEIIIPSTYNSLPVTAIAESAFSGQTQITNIYVPDSVTSIDNAAFAGCSGLTNITLPFVGSSAYATEASASTLFGYIFGTTDYTGCTASLQYYANSSYKIYYIPTTLTTVTITGGGILYGAFYSCTNITSITIPNSVTYIGSAAFKYCSSLTSVIV